MSHTPLEGTEFSGKILKKVSYTHDAMIDHIIANPGVDEQTLADLFGFSKTWVNRLICSDAFQARLALRKSELVDPVLTATVEERMRGVTMQSLEILSDSLEATQDPVLALKTLELTTKAESYGARKGAVVQNNFVVALPPKAESADEWASAHRPQRPITIDQSPEDE